jgi:hypothetical protein
MKTIKVEMTLQIEDNAIKDIKKWEHHIEYAIDLNEYPEIKNISNVKVKEI